MKMDFALFQLFLSRVSIMLVGLLLSFPVFSSDQWSTLITLRDNGDGGWVSPIHATLMPSGELLFFGESRLTEDPYESPLADRAEVTFKLNSPDVDQLVFPDTIWIDNLHTQSGLDFQEVADNPAIDFLDADSTAVWTYRDQFVCAGHTFLADGRLFIAGGTRKVLKQNTPLPVLEDRDTWTNYHVFGLPFSMIYDGSSGWAKTPDFLGKGFLGQFLTAETGETEDVTWRWYSTATRLKDNRILITAGQDYVIGAYSQYANGGGIANLSVEIYDPVRNSYDLLLESDYAALAIYNVDYTHVFQLPQPIAGRDVLMLGQFGIPVMFSPDAQLLLEGIGSRPTRPVQRLDLTPDSFAVDVAGAASTTEDAQFLEPNYGASSTMLPLRINNGEWGYNNGSVLTAGGQINTTAHSTAHVYDPYVNQWTEQLELGVGRHHPSTVLLPDGRVLLFAGHTNGSSANLNKVQYIDPANQFLISGGTAEYPEVRGYHSVALLLPDGRVLLGGGTDDKNALAEKPNLRLYSPDYMSAARPELYYLSDTNLNFAQYYYVTWDPEYPVEELVLMSLGSMTHSFDQNQRYVQLEIQQSTILENSGLGASLFRAPLESATAPAGDYMLFAIDSERVPSVAKMVRLE